MRSARRAWARDLRYTSALLAVGVLAGAGCGSVRSQSATASASSRSASSGSASTGSASTSASGIAGLAVARLCPGADIGAQSCARRQVQATIDVLQMPSGRRVSSARTDPAGRFRLVLSPGSYELKTHVSGALLWARAITVQVVAHRFARVTLRLIPRHPLPIGASS